MAQSLRPSKKAELTLSRIPPLTALRAFTATARHLSFIRAADELHVTPAAIGQHIRQLEGHFGQQLFLRNRGQLELTSEGRSLFPGLQQAFEMVLSAVSNISAGSKTPELRISAPSSFLSKWLIPRLAEIRDDIPDASIVLKRDEDGFTDEGDRPNCAIKLAGPDVPGPDAYYLFQEEMVAVCTPSYRLRYSLTSDDFGLDRTTLLAEARHEIDSLYPGWDRWFKVNAIEQGHAARRITLADPSMVIDAALAGQGVGLASLALVQRELTAGRLVIPYGAAMPMRQAYFLLGCETSMTASLADRFRRWLLQEADVVRSRRTVEAGLSDRGLSIAAE